MSLSWTGAWTGKCAKPCILPDPLTGKIHIQGDLRGLHPIQGGAGGQDQAMETQHWCDHLPEDKGQVQPLDQETHVHLRPWGWLKIPVKYSGIIWGTGKRSTFLSSHAAGVLSDSLMMFKILKYNIQFSLIPWQIISKSSQNFSVNRLFVIFSEFSITQIHYPKTSCDYVMVWWGNHPPIQWPIPLRQCWRHQVFKYILLRGDISLELQRFAFRHGYHLSNIVSHLFYPFLYIVHASNISRLHPINSFIYTFTRHFCCATAMCLWFLWRIYGVFGVLECIQFLCWLCLFVQIVFLIPDQQDLSKKSLQMYRRFPDIICLWSVPLLWHTS